MKRKKERQPGKSIKYKPQKKAKVEKKQRSKEETSSQRDQLLGELSKEKNLVQELQTSLANVTDLKDMHISKGVNKLVRQVYTIAETDYLNELKQFQKLLDIETSFLNVPRTLPVATDFLTRYRQQIRQMSYSLTGRKETWIINPFRLGVYLQSYFPQKIDKMQDLYAGHQASREHHVEQFIHEFLRREGIATMYQEYQQNEERADFVNNLLEQLFLYINESWIAHLFLCGMLGSEELHQKYYFTQQKKAFDETRSPLLHVRNNPTKMDYLFLIPKVKDPKETFDKKRRIPIKIKCGIRANTTTILTSPEIYVETPFRVDSSDKLVIHEWNILNVMHSDLLIFNHILALLVDHFAFPTVIAKMCREYFTNAFQIPKESKLSFAVGRYEPLEYKYYEL
jgi:hypothetical protein